MFDCSKHTYIKDLPVGARQHDYKWGQIHAFGKTTITKKYLKNNKIIVLPTKPKNGRPKRAAHSAYPTLSH